MIFFIIFYLACSLYAWGTAMADWNYSNKYEWPSLGCTVRDHLVIVFMTAIIGPIGALVAVVCTNFNQHGWELWEHKE